MGIHDSRNRRAMARGQDRFDSREHPDYYLPMEEPEEEEETDPEGEEEEPCLSSEPDAASAAKSA